MSGDGRRRGAPVKRVVEGAVMRAIFPVDAERRRFLQAVGATAASAAVAAAFPIATATDVFAQGAAPEKKDLKIVFIPITCATHRSSWPRRWASMPSRASTWR